ncbi:MAG: ATP-binding protein [Chloroflexi bacterium]|nr:ATP-binding protein [Chloroflexota bacterium]
MQTLFQRLQQGAERNLRDANPWWNNQPMRQLPPLKRWAFEPVLARLKGGLAPVIVLRGARQVGKTTLLQQIIQQLLDEGVEPQRILRVQFDELPSLLELSEPILELSRWFEQSILGKTFNTADRDGRPAFLFFDEVQNLPDWAPQLKHLVDLHGVRVMVTGSSALRIEMGRDSLAGRLSTVEMGPLYLREISALRGFAPIPAFLPFNGLTPLKDKKFWQDLASFGQQHTQTRHAAFAAFSERGAYPIAHVHAERPWEELADQLNETIIRRVIQHDLRIGEKGRRRDEKLLEEVFRVACRYIGQSPNQPLYLDELKRAMGANIGWQRILAYLRFLNGTLLVRLIEPLELRLKRRRGASKLCLCDHALRASWLQEVVPLTEEGLAAQPHLSDLAGHVAESVVGYFVSSILGLDVAHFPERGAEPEVDFVLTVGEQRIPIEVKYRRRIEYSDTRGLRSFIERSVYNAPFGLLITLNESVDIDDPRIVAMPLSTLLLLR